jgi:hypothetical protein
MSGDDRNRQSSSTRRHRANRDSSDRHPKPTTRRQRRGPTQGGSTERRSKSDQHTNERQNRRHTETTRSVKRGSNRLNEADQRNQSASSNRAQVNKLLDFEPDLSSAEDRKAYREQQKLLAQEVDLFGYRGKNHFRTQHIVFFSSAQIAAHNKKIRQGIRPDIQPFANRADIERRMRRLRAQRPWYQDLGILAIAGALVLLVGGGITYGVLTSSTLLLSRDSLPPDAKEAWYEINRLEGNHATLQQQIAEELFAQRQQELDDARAALARREFNEAQNLLDRFSFEDAALYTTLSRVVGPHQMNDQEVALRQQLTAAKQAQRNRDTPASAKSGDVRTTPPGANTATTGQHDAGPAGSLPPEGLRISQATWNPDNKRSGTIIVQLADVSRNGYLWLSGNEGNTGNARLVAGGSSVRLNFIDPSARTTDSQRNYWFRFPNRLRSPNIAITLEGDWTTVGDLIVSAESTFPEHQQAKLEQDKQELTKQVATTAKNTTPDGHEQPQEQQATPDKDASKDSIAADANKTEPQEASRPNKATAEATKPGESTSSETTEPAQAQSESPDEAHE